MTSPEQQTNLDRLFAMPMFCITVLYLATAGTAVHLIADEAGRYEGVAEACGLVLIFLTPLYLLEFLLHWRSGGSHLRQNIWYCLFPPLRLGARDHVQGTTTWLPGMDWQVANEKLAGNVELKLGYPMIGIALLILPLLGVEFVYATKIEENAWLGFVIKLAGTFIWLAFAMEFLIVISMVSRKVKFVKAHWLDLAIILLPFIAFLRVARIGQLSRMMRVKQLGKLTRTARVFRLRGLAMRAWRAILILEIVDRMIHRDPVKRMKMLEEQLAEKEEEVAEIKREIQLLEEAINEPKVDGLGSKV